MNRLLYAYIVIAIVTLSSCGDYFRKGDQIEPQVQIDSISYTNGNTYVYGKIVNAGHYAIQQLGLCYNTSGDPKIEENQIIEDFNGVNTFSFTLNNLYVDSTYFFKVYAISNVALGISNEMNLTIPRSAYEQPPCDYAIDVISINGVEEMTYDVSYDLPDWGFTEYYAVKFSTNLYQFVFKFTSVPTTGVYYVCPSTEIVLEQSKKVAVLINKLNSGTYEVFNSHKIYVEKVQNDSLYISFCDLPYSNEFEQTLISGKISYSFE